MTSIPDSTKLTSLPDSTKLSRSEAGRRGGLARKEQLGHQGYVELGKKGGKARAQRMAQQKAYMQEHGIVNPTNTLMPPFQPKRRNSTGGAGGGAVRKRGGNGGRRKSLDPYSSQYLAMQANYENQVKFGGVFAQGGDPSVLQGFPESAMRFLLPQNPQPTNAVFYPPVKEAYELDGAVADDHMLVDSRPYEQAMYLSQYQQQYEEHNNPAPTFPSIAPKLEETTRDEKGDGLMFSKEEIESSFGLNFYTLPRYNMEEERPET